MVWGLVKGSLVIFKPVLGQSTGRERGAGTVLGRAIDLGDRVGVAMAVEYVPHTWLAAIGSARWRRGRVCSAALRCSMGRLATRPHAPRTAQHSTAQPRPGVEEYRGRELGARGRPGRRCNVLLIDGTLLAVN